jgi:hypothetical protein
MADFDVFYPPPAGITVALRVFLSFVQIVGYDDTKFAMSGETGASSL